MKKKLRISIVVSYTYPFIGSGLGNVALNQAEYLAKQHHEVTLISSNVPKTKKEFKKNNVRFLKIDALNFLYAFHIPVPIFLFNKKIIDVIKNSDIVHVHDILYPSSFLAVFFAKLYRKPVIVMQHIPFIKYDNHVVNALQKLVFFSIGVFILHASNTILYCNTEVANWLEKYKKKLVYLPNGVNTSFFHPVSSAQSNILRKKYAIPLTVPIILFVGRLVPKKGYKLVYQANNKNYVIVFVGSGKISTEMKQNQNTIFLGPKSQNELRDLYQLSDVFILPSHSEGFPMSVQEAMSSGLAIIVSDLACYAEMKLDRHYIKFVKNSVFHIKSAIKETLSKPGLMKQMQQYSYETAAQYYSWEKNSNRLVKIYWEAIDE